MFITSRNNNRVKIIQTSLRCILHKLFADWHANIGSMFKKCKRGLAQLAGLPPSSQLVLIPWNQYAKSRSLTQLSRSKAQSGVKVSLTKLSGVFLVPILYLGRLFTKSLVWRLTVALPLPFVHPSCSPPWDSERITLPCCWPSGPCVLACFALPLLSTITHACLALGTGGLGSLCLVSTETSS